MMLFSMLLLLMTVGSGCGPIDLAELDASGTEASAEDDPLPETPVEDDPPAEQPADEPAEEPANSEPLADAGDDQEAEGGSLVQLDGSGSSDPDGDPLSHSWVQLSGTTVALSGADTATPSFIAPDEDGLLVFELTVDDGQGGEDSDTMSVTLQAQVVPQLYIACLSGHNVVSYRDPSEVNGNEVPDGNLEGAQTQLSAPSDIVVNSAGELVVTNFATPAITVYEEAAEANGNLEPVAIVQGAATELAGPASLAIDAEQDLAFVADVTLDAILVYADTSAASFNGNRAPIRTIHTATSGDLLDPVGINFGADDELYVANRGAGNILVFANAGSLNGDVLPSRVITSAEFGSLFDVFIDQDDTMYVVDDANGAIHIFEDAASLSGSQTPDFTLTIPGAAALTAIAVDTGGTGYVVDLGSDAVYSYDGIATLHGTIGPDRMIQGGSTQMDQPIRVFLVE